MLLRFFYQYIFTNTYVSSVYHEKSPNKNYNFNIFNKFGNFCSFTGRLGRGAIYTSIRAAAGPNLSGGTTTSAPALGETRTRRECSSRGSMKGISLRRKLRASLWRTSGRRRRFCQWKVRSEEIREGGTTGGEGGTNDFEVCFF